MTKKLTDKEFYESKISPIVEKLEKLCEKNNSPAVFAFQLSDAEDKKSGAVSAVLIEEMSMQMDMAYGILSGEAEMILMPVESQPIEEPSIFQTNKNKNQIH